MRKRWKIFWIVCAVLAGIGLVCLIAAKAMGVTKTMFAENLPNGISFGENVYIDADDEWNDDISTSGESYAGIRVMNVKVSAGQIEFRTSEELDNEIRVETYDVDKKLKLNWHADGHELVITGKGKLIHSKHANEIYVYIPKDYSFDEFSMDIGAGLIYMENVTARDFSLDVGAGEAEIMNFTADETDFAVGMGTITATGMVKHEADFECGAGEINYTAYGKETDYNYEVECGIGEVNCGESSYSGLAHSREINNHSSKSMYISCGIGSITINFEDRL